VTSSSLCVVGTDATMVADALHNALALALGDLDPSFALEDFSASDAGEAVASRVLEALNTPAFLVERRVVAVRDAQQLSAADADALAGWMKNPTPATVLVIGVVGAKSHRLVKAAGEVIEVNVGSRVADRVAFVKEKMAQYRVTIDASTAQQVAERVGDDVARVDALARTLAAIFGSSPLNFAKLEPYLGDAGDVPAWDLTDAIDAGDATLAIKVARRMLDSRSRAGLQLIAVLQRHYLNMTRLEGSGATTKEEAAAILGGNPFPAGKALTNARRLGPARLATAVHWLSEADLALKGAVSYGGRDVVNDQDLTELTVLEVLVARLARLSNAARRS
jgi:DNA polymerase-3 subunit delta